MELAFRVFGEVGATPVVIVHGLLGSSRNWQTAAKDLGERYRVYALDLRNHGDSPHASPHSYAAMCEDLVEWMESQSIAKAILIGHSMGGKLAMKFACERPERVAKLVVVDIAPKVYPNSHDDDLSAMLSIDTHSLANRSEADEALQTAVPDWGLRQFLLTSLIRDEAGDGFRWQPNVREIYENRSLLESTPLDEGMRFSGEVLFILGEKSRYFADSDVVAALRHFPESSFEAIPNCGHNPHFEKKDAFVEIVKRFCG